VGGFAAQRLAARAPERVERLVLLSTDAGGPRAQRAEPAVWARLIDHEACGERDAVIPPANAALLADRWPEARVERFADGGHAFMAQHPARTANVIESFLHR